MEVVVLNEAKELLFSPIMACFVSTLSLRSYESSMKHAKTTSDIFNITSLSDPIMTSPVDNLSFAAASDAAKYAQ